MILVTERGLKRDPKLGSKIDAAIIPGLQGGPHNATTAAIALAAEEASRPAFAAYARQIKKNATALAAGLMSAGLTLVGQGTETHLMIIDLTPIGPGLGTQVAFAMDAAGMYANRNTVPNEPGSPFYPSGIRLGTPLVTTRGMKEAEMKQIASWIKRVVDIATQQELPTDKAERAIFLKQFRATMSTQAELASIRQEVKVVASKFPLFTW
jgi:glycine hydroxymethyltransferase